MFKMVLKYSMLVSAVTYWVYYSTVLGSTSDLNEKLGEKYLDFTSH